MATPPCPRQRTALARASGIAPHAPALPPAAAHGRPVDHAGAAQAYDITTSPHLFGDWGGLRTSLSERGIDLNLGYTGEAAHNFSGGKDKLTRYTDQWVFGATLNLDKLWAGAAAPSR